MMPEKPRYHHLAGPLLLAILNALWPHSTSEAQVTDPPLTSRLRRPAAVALLDQDRWLFVANRRSGTLSVIEAATNRVAAEWAVGRKLSDVVSLPDDRHLVVADEGAGQLILLRWFDTMLTEVSRLDVPAAPVSLRLSADGQSLAVASLWAHRVTLVDLSAGSREANDDWRVAKVIELPFAPRKTCFVARGTKLVVADAFGGRLAIIDADRGELRSVRELPGHNIRGLTTTADGRWLLVAHQFVSPLARADREDIHWGTLLRNNLRWLTPEYVTDKKANLLAASRLEFLGGTGSGTADPGEVLALPDGRIALAASGINAVLLSRADVVGYRRIDVGRRPTGLAARKDGKQIYVANTLADSISVLDMGEGRVAAEISLGPQPELSLADRGELLFYDGRLSHDGWMSCHSCHPDGHTNNQLVDNFTDGSYGDPKRVLSLLGTGDTPPWAWNAGMADLERQSRVSITSTMQGAEPTSEQAAALAAFVRSLPPPPRVAPSDEQVADAGRQLFDRLGCQQCHPAPWYTSPGTFDVGTSDQNDQQEFNPPSLRGIIHRDRFFHDNRAERLTDVFRKHHHQVPNDLSGREVRELLAFLRTL